MTTSEGYAAQAEAVMRAGGGKRPPSVDAKVITLGLLALAQAVKETSK